ncbi:MAG: trehalose-phosphatase [Geodermatophilaceae bacterium]|nr:trehalose-phosphatase [Geodermatophilaceae bacterium]
MLAEALAELVRARRLLVVSDFDGVLAPIVDDPAASRPLPVAIDALRAMTVLPDTFVALVSGRALADLSALSGLGAPVRLVGSHGAEWSTGPVAGFDAERAAVLAGVTDAMEDIADRYPGVTAERKPVTAVLHVRRAARPDAAAATAELERGLLRWPGLHVTHGKEIVEVAVLANDKGAAVLALRSSVAADAVLFLGDDVTDEDAFATLGAQDVGVKVGPGATRAAYRVDTPQDAAAVLTDLVVLRSS